MQREEVEQGTWLSPTAMTGCSLAGENQKNYDFLVDFSGKMRIIILRMDTLIKRGSADFPSCPNPAEKSYIVGSKQLRKALLRGQITKVYLAQDADPALTEPLEQLCYQLGLECTWVRHMTQLGQMCGIEVGAAAAGC